LDEKVGKGKGSKIRITRIKGLVDWAKERGIKTTKGGLVTEFHFSRVAREAQRTYYVSQSTARD